MNAQKELISKLKKDILLWQGFKPQVSHANEAMGLGEIEAAFPNGVFPKKAGFYPKSFYKNLQRR